MAWQDYGTYKEGVGWSQGAQSAAANDMASTSAALDAYRAANPDEFGGAGEYNPATGQWTGWQYTGAHGDGLSSGTNSAWDNLLSASDSAKSAYSESQRKSTPVNGPWYSDPNFLAFAAIATGGLAATGAFSGAAAGSTAAGTGATAGEGAGYFGGISQGAGGVTGLTSGAGGVTGLTAGVGTTLGSGSLEAAIAGAAGGSGVGFGGSSGGWLSTAKDAYNTYSNANKIYNGVGALTGVNSTPYGSYQNTGTRAGGSMAGTTGIDWGSMFGGAGNSLLANYLSQQGVDNANNLASNIKFKPYSISSNLGQSYQDPTTGQVVSSLSAPFAQQQQNMLGQVGSNLAAANADPMLASQDAYGKMKQLSSFQDQQQRNALEDRLQQQGMLGSTGGGTQMQAYQNSMNDKDVNMQLQSVGLGQQLTNNATTRAMQNWTGAMAPTAAMAQQVYTGGQFGNYAQQGQFAGANLVNQADQNRLKALGLGGSQLLGSAGLQGGVNSLFGGSQGGSTNWLNALGSAGSAISGAGNWLGGLFDSSPSSSYSNAAAGNMIDLGNSASTYSSVDPYSLSDYSTNYDPYGGLFGSLGF